MSTERIDHADEALRTLDQALSYGAYGEDVGAIVSMIAAQAHATLALVEQQRIANLIAYAADVDVIRSGNYDLNLEIRKALGL